MKITFLIAALLFFANSCKTSPQNYEGYVFRGKGKPANNIKVCEENKNNCTTTNQQGFFKLQKQETSIRNLIVFQGNNPIDTIKTVWSQHGEKIKYSFIEGKKDTLFIE